MTAFLQTFTIRTRMLGAIGMVLGLVLLLGAAGLFGLRSIASISDDFARHAHADTVTLGALRTAMGNVSRFEKDLLINYDSSVEQANQRPKWNAAVESARRHAQALAAGGSAVVAPKAVELDKLIAAYVEAATPVLRQIEVGGFNDAPVADKAIAPAKQHMQAGETVVDAIAAQLELDAAAHTVARGQSVAWATWIFIGALFVAVAVVVPLTLLNMSSICRPIENARTLAERIATGDLTSRIEITGRDETTQLLQALAKMQDSLRTLVGQVRSTTGSITTASSEIASGNQDLSVRTEQTASNLQQTASSMVQLTGTVKQSADSARQANQLAASAAEVAQRGGAVVAQVVATMDDINASSNRIGDIIGVIDGIAFQTNILALNAAVEAARAGEQGRGFAVVASEVRSLAQRSAAAAKEIKGLIGASVEKVEGGSRLVADAGRTMSEIVSSVQRVSDIIGEITAAASEQSEGIGQINGSVTQLDQMTQQNAALVEQSAAAAESLKSQAASLAQVVGTFRLDAHAPAATAVPARRAPPAAPKEPPTAARPNALDTMDQHTPARPAEPKRPVNAPVGGFEGDWETF